MDHSKQHSTRSTGWSVPHQPPISRPPPPVTTPPPATASQTVYGYESLAKEIERLLSPPPPPQPAVPAAPQYLQQQFWSVPPRSRHASSTDSGIDINDEVEIPFHANGVEREMDELDIKLIRSRCSPVLPSSRSAPIRGLDEPLTLEELRSMLLSRGRANKRDLTCVFCKNNNEAVFIYTSHNLKDENGRVLCPILREYECPNCRAKGDNAHTLKYCPLAPEAMGIGSLRTPRTSTGRRRTRAGELAARLGRRPPPSQLLPADKFQRVIGPLL